MKTFMPAYWPMFRTSELRRFDYTDKTGVLDPITSVFSYDRATASMRYDDFNGDGSWRDTWFYQYRPGFGIAEWQDYEVMPAGILTSLFGTRKRVVMDPPIGWGEFLDVGEKYTNRPVMVPWRCLPPQVMSGKNEVTLVEHLDSYMCDGVIYSDVIKMFYQQSWGGNPPVGANYWMALGVGPVAIQWAAVNPADGELVFSPVIRASVTSFNT